MIEDEATPSREPITRWWLLWSLYGLPRCSQAWYPPDYSVEPCQRLIWPWQPREVRLGHPVHVACLTADRTPEAESPDSEPGAGS